MNKRCRPNNKGAFSLIEVVIAMGVVAFAVVTLISLLPTGLASYQQSRSVNTQTAIVQQVNNALQNASFTDIFNAGSNPLTLTTTIQTQLNHQYDADGLDVTAGQSTNSPVYSVVLSTVPFVPPGITAGLSGVNTAGTVVPVAGVVQIKLNYHNTVLNNSTLVVNKGH